MKASNWKKKVEIAESLDSLAGLRESIVDDPSLSDEEITQLEQLIKDKEDVLISTTSKRKKKTDELEGVVSRPILFDSRLYDRNTEEDKPSYEILLETEMDYNSFLKEIFYQEFIKLPEPEIQVPLCMAIGYLNSMVVPDTVSFPMIYVYSPEEESGKSQLAYHWGDYYHPDYRIFFRDDSTGAGLRNRLTPVANLDQPCIAVLDNFNARTTKERLGNIGWASLLCYNRLESQSQLVADTEGGVVQFNTHCLKVFTSITPLGNTVESSSELKSRCVRIYANKHREGVNLFRQAYNWNGLQKIYFDIWGDPDRCNRIYKKGLLKELLQKSHKDLPFYNRKWQISIPIIASGVFAGVWPDLNSAIKHMAIYWEWEGDKKSNKMSPLETIIELYVTEHHPALVKEHLEEIEGTRRLQSIFPNVIRLADIYRHLEKLAAGKGFSEVRKTTANDNLICNIFYGMGFVSDMERSESGRPLGMYFYKQ